MPRFSWLVPPPFSWLLGGVCLCVGCLFCAWGRLAPASSGLLAGDECASFPRARVGGCRGLR